jgi:hypothetical protein
MDASEDMRKAQRMTCPHRPDGNGGECNLCKTKQVRGLNQPLRRRKVLAVGALVVGLAGLGAAWSPSTAWGPPSAACAALCPNGHASLRSRSFGHYMKGDGPGYVDHLENQLDANACGPCEITFTFPMLPEHEGDPLENTIIIPYPNHRPRVGEDRKMFTP